MSEKSAKDNSPKEFETELKSMKETIKQLLNKFNSNRAVFAAIYRDNYILDIKNEYERLEYIVGNLCVFSSYVSSKDPKYPEDYVFSCNILEVEELTDICKLCFPNHKVRWDPPEECGGEDPTVYITKKVSKAKLTEVRTKLAKLRKEQNEVTQEIHKLDQEEINLSQIVQD